MVQKGRDLIFLWQVVEGSAINLHLNCDIV